MADNRNPKYSGMLNLVKECGPVLIELDTNAKTATASLVNTESQYTLSGGGGSAEYVIPVQDATFVKEHGSVKAFVSNVNIEGLDDGAMVVGKAIFNDKSTFDVGTYTQSDKKLEFNELGNIQYLNNAWTWQMQGIPAGTVMNLTVVKNF